MKERKPQKERKPHGVQLLIRAIVKDPEGRILSDTGQKPTKSFVIQFLEWLRFHLHQPTRFNYATGVSGFEEIINDTGRLSFDIDAGVNIDSFGIVIGTGDVAEDNEDYKLGTQLTEGAGVGNITHGAQVVEAPDLVGGNVDIETKRSFINNTGSTIIVKEAGIYTRGEQGHHSNADEHHCIIRDVLDAPGVNVPDKCALTVYYTLRTTVTV